MTGQFREIIPLAGGEWIVSFTTRAHPGALFEKLKGKPVDIDVKRASKGRSRDANAFCWALCADIGTALGIDKADVYRRAIRSVGVYLQKDLPLWDVETVRQRWESHGTGWIFETVDDARTGWKTCNLYFGSSTYTVDEMRRLLDWLVDEAQQLEIPIPVSKREAEEMLERWGRK